MKEVKRILKRKSIVFSPHRLSFLILTVKLAELTIEHLIGQINQFELQLIWLPIGEYSVKIII